MKSSARLVRARDTSPPASPRQRPAVPPIPGFTPRSEDVYAHYLRGIAPERLVVGAGLLTLSIYAGFVAAFPITVWWNHPHLASDPTAINDIGRITGYSAIAAFLFVGAILVLFACQFLALIAVARVKQDKPVTEVDRLVQRSVLLFPLLFAAIMVWMQPVTTTDLYGYVARGYLYAQLHANPMTTPAVLLPGGLSVDRPAAPYGPVWLLIAGMVFRVFGDNLLATMLAFKVIELGFVAGAIVLVDRLAHTLYPQRRLRIDVLFGWSPLLIFEAIGNGHNDIVMVVCVLGAFALMIKGRARTAFALLVLGALVKYFSVVFVALWLVYELRHRTHPTLVGTAEIEPNGLRRWTGAIVRTVAEVDRWAAANLLASAAVIGVALVAIFYAPFWAGTKTFTGLSQQLQPLYYNGSIVGFIAAPLALLVPTHAEQAALDKVVRLVCYALYGLYVLIQARRLWRRGPDSDMRDVLTAAAKLTLVALLLITFWYQPWYVVWLLPLAALAGEPFVRRQGTILALGSLSTYVVANFLLVDETGVGRDLFVQFFEILVAFGPLLLLRASPDEPGWKATARRYIGLLGTEFRAQSVLLERVMLGLIVLVAAILRLVRLGNLFVEAPSTGAAADILKQASGDLRLFLSDPQGLQGPFVAVEGLLVAIFGRTPFAALLPSAVLGALTVVVIYAVTVEIMTPPGQPKKRAVALLAALLAATSRWHVSLSRSGMEVVILPLLLCVAVYLILLALRTGPSSPVVPAAVAPRPRPPVHSQPRHRSARSRRSVRSMPIPRDPQVGLATHGSERRRALLYAGSGLATGLACDVAPGLWLVPLVIAGVLILWRWHRRDAGAPSLRDLGVLGGSMLIAGIPVIWYYASRAIGFPAGNQLLAQSSVRPHPGPGVLSPAFWGQVAHNAGSVIGLLASQDYSAGYPSVGGTPIIPTLLGPFFYIGVVIIIVRWRQFSSLALMLLVALPLVASIAVGTPASVIEAASVLPAMCIIPALAMYEIAVWLGHLPILLDRANGSRIFTSPEQIGRILLFIFLLASALRTFYWYFEVTLPTSGPNQFTPSLVPSHLVQTHPDGLGDLRLALTSQSTHAPGAQDGVAVYTLVYTSA